MFYDNYGKQKMGFGICYYAGIPLEDISQAIQTAADPGRVFNVMLRF